MLPKSLVHAFPTLFMVLSLSACATLFTGTRDTISFNSTPAGATILIDGIEMGKTPATILVKRSLGDKLVTLKMPGYQDRTFALSKTFNVVSVLNLGSILGWGVDAATGAVFKYDRFSYEMELEQRTAMAAQLEVDHVMLITELERNEAGDLIFVTEQGKSIAVIDQFTNTVLKAR
jgi:hypothetical protein